MTQLLWKTRADSRPEGKACVYICACPEEREAVLQTVGAQILELQNVALMYCPEGEFLEAEALKGMALVVVAVTDRFLDEEAGALAEYRTALELKIPTLPLMQGKDLAERFNRICGERHMLDPFSKDETGLSFPRKLEDHLEQVLGGNEVREKIRTAFPRRIFLSYRKMDRRHAKGLMKAVHDCPGCEGVSIWYDEYLVPGRDFNEEIQKVLQGSHLFVLMVTPNVLEKGNYVLAYEYPAARDKIPVLAVEMEATDQVAFREAYRPLTGCTSPELLAAALEEKLGKPEEQTHTPEQEYLMGMGYLLGVEVEVDRQRALRLMESAAGKGCVNAVAQLAQMYRYGIVVERSFPKELQLRRELLELVKDREDELTLKATIDLAECLWEQRDFTDAEAYYRKGLNLSAMLGAHKQQLVCMGRLGDIAMKNGDMGEAEKHYLARLTGSKLLAKTSGRDQDLGEVAMSGVRLADLLSRKNRYKAAKLCLKESIGLFRDLAKRDHGPTARRELAAALGYYGDLFRAENPRWALKQYKDSAGILRQLAEEFRDVGFYRDLAVTCEHMAELQLEQGELTKALRTLEDGEKANRQVLELLPSPAARRGVAAILSRKGLILRKLERFDQAQACYEECIRTTEALMKSFPDEELLVMLLHHYLGMLDLQLDRKASAEVEHWLEKLSAGLKATEHLRHRTDRMDAQFQFLDRMAYIACIERDRERAIDWYGEAMVAGMELLKVSDTPANRVKMAGVCMKFAMYTEDAELCLQAGELLEAIRTVEAKRLYLNCTDKLWQLVSQTELLMPVWDEAEPAGSVLVQEEPYCNERALRVWENSLCIVREQAKKDAARWLPEVAEWVYRFGIVRERQGRKQEARELFLEYIRVNTQLGDLWAVAEGYELLCLVVDAVDPDALKLAQEGLEIDRRLMQEDPERAFSGIQATLLRCVYRAVCCRCDRQAMEYARELMALLKGRRGCKNSYGCLLSNCAKGRHDCLQRNDRETATAYMELAEQIMEDLQEPLRRGDFRGHIYEYAELSILAMQEMGDRFFLFEAYALLRNLHEQYPEHRAVQDCYMGIKWHIEKLEQ